MLRKSPRLSVIAKQSETLEEFSYAKVALSQSHKVFTIPLELMAATPPRMSWLRILSFFLRILLPQLIEAHCNGGCIANDKPVTKAVCGLGG